MNARRHQFSPDIDPDSHFPGPRPEPHAPLDGLRVLVVDDNPSDLERFSAWLALLGADVTCARTLRGSQEALRRADFHVLVLDFLLPDGNPIALLSNHEGIGGRIVASGLIDAASWAMIERANAVPAPKSQLRSPLLLMGFVEEALRRAGLPVRAMTQDRPRREGLDPELRGSTVEDPWVVTRNPVTVDLVRRQVSVLGEARWLQPKQYDVLVYLMFKAGKVVTEAELLENVWAHTTHSEPASLVRSTISRIRAALQLPGDSFIQTAPGGWGIGVWSSLPDGKRRRFRSDG